MAGGINGSLLAEWKVMTPKEKAPYEAREAKLKGMNDTQSLSNLPGCLKIRKPLLLPLELPLEEIHRLQLHDEDNVHTNNSKVSARTLRRNEGGSISKHEKKAEKKKRCTEVKEEEVEFRKLMKGGVSRSHGAQRVCCVQTKLWTPLP
ncbi:hypothetical protein CAEBREN_19486 [Caenorhabditis brenneri]|uniref:Uncharacterized protein n=1 Tax=Caenorhabditis brenneri TaxID=135651 RepID=G0PCY9_CAEBE|nr:hypothetical protein CAEBREN_19486 [Caenorhabditis brenneri]